jgi:predicted nucleic acid binding AN1-type Zn finger protein
MSISNVANNATTINQNQTPAALTLCMPCQGCTGHGGVVHTGQHCADRFEE